MPNGDQTRELQTLFNNSDGAKAENQRLRLGYRPVPGPNERVTELELTDEHSALAPHELLELEVALDPQTGTSYLRRPAGATSKR
jgi:hypothetical protein